MVVNKDLLSGVVLLVIAGLYYLGSGTIADSTLSDEVGAAGLPQVLSVVLAGLGLLLIIRSLVARREASRSVANDNAQDARLLRGVGFLTFGLGYVLLLPVLGYFVSVALLIASVAVFERSEQRWLIPVVAVGGAAFYWAVFVKLLGVNQPIGTLLQGLLS